MPRIRLSFFLSFFLLCLTAAGQTPVTTSGGAANSVPKFTGSSTVGDSAITETSGKVGIGTSSPSQKLSIFGGNLLVTQGAGADANSGLRLVAPISTIHYNWMLGAQQNVNAALEITPSTTQGGTTFSTPVAVFTSSGNVGVGTSSPDSRLSVFGGNLLVNNGGAPNSTSGLRLVAPISSNHYNWMIGAQQNVSSALEITPSTTPGGTSFSTPVAVFSSSGNVGIGTTSPAQKLSVAGTVESTTGGFRFPDGTTQTTAAYNTGGTITGVTAGAGLTGGGSSGSVQLAVDGTVARTNTSNTFTTQQTFNNYPLIANDSLLVDTGQLTSVYGVRSIISSGIAGGFWNKQWYDTSWGTGSIIAGYAGTGMTQMFHVDTRGTTYTYNGYVAGGFDYAEIVQVSSPAQYEPGDVLTIDKKGNYRFVLSNEPNSRLVAGVYSTAPGILGSPLPMEAKLSDGEVPLALIGQVPCKVSSENGPVEVGDLLVTAATPGYAMRADDNVKAGTILGKALEPLPNGKAKIKILVTLQ